MHRKVPNDLQCVSIDILMAYVILISLNVVVLNSRNRKGKLWLSQFSHF